MPPIRVTSNGVVKLLKNLQPHKAIEVIAPNSHSCSKRSSREPSVKTVPIFKNGDRSKPSNYLQVSLTAICCKLLGHIIHTSIVKHFDKHDVLTDVQHGFRKKRSCDIQLISR